MREPVAGLACAHNRGLVDVRTPIVAFTDDDVLADPGWLRNLVSAFGDDPSIGCVTGLIFPVELETQAQEWLEGYAGYAKGLVRTAFDLHEHRPDDALFPWTAGTLGSGANMAFRTDLLRQLGGFDAALGAGSMAMGGDDLAAFFDVVASGSTLVYEPAAVVVPPPSPWLRGAPHSGVRVRRGSRRLHHPDRDPVSEPLVPGRSPRSESRCTRVAPEFGEEQPTGCRLPDGAPTA